MANTAEKIDIPGGGLACGGNLLYGAGATEDMDTLDTPRGSVKHRTDLQVVKRYGHLYEGTQTIPTADKPFFKRRYAARRTLADLAGCPEGFEFQHQLDGQMFRAVILLTPPHMVAVCNENGKWERRARNEAVDGPQPYSAQWYAAYLRHNQLPAWFMTTVHIDILTNDIEAQLLGLTIADLPFGREISSTYLAVRYPTPPQFPELVGAGQHQSYTYSLSEEEQLRLARYFPATNMLGPDRRVIIKPGGYIFVHHEPEGFILPSPATDSVRWSSSAASRASYITERPDAISFSYLLSPSAAKRSGIAAARSSNGGFVNPTERMSGLGAWEWLEADVDAPLAEVLGFYEPGDVATAYLRGHLRVGRGPYAGPSVVWQPDMRYFNPTLQPSEDGRWEFLNDESREKAREQLGGQGAFGLAESPEPTADEMWQIRQSFRNLMVDSGSQHDPTAEIDLVWILAGDGEAAETEPVYGEDGVQLVAQEETTQVDDTQIDDSTQAGDTGFHAPVEDDQGHGHDRTNGLAHAPSNGDENYQTASDGRGEYWTRMIKGKKITVDRARAQPIRDDEAPQLHRLWTYTEGGKWLRFPETKAKLNWNDKAGVEKLNRWRQQTEQRNGWESKRRETREGYTLEQRAWVFDFIVNAKGGRPLQGPLAICKDFSKKFKSARAPKAIEALIDRLVKEYKDNGGKLKERKERQPAKKKRKTKGGKADEEQVDTPMADIPAADVEDCVVDEKVETVAKEAVVEREDEDAPHESDVE